MKKIFLLPQVIKEMGLSGVAYFSIHMVKNKLKTPHRLKDGEKIISHFTGKYGLEIGGPSQVFSRRSLLPIYQIAGGIDNVNYDTETVWTGKIKKDAGYVIRRKQLGKQFILEATNLGKIKKNTYDFVLSSNNLEHIANPLRAIWEFRRVLKPKGLLLLVVPRKESNFDRLRQTTDFSHLLEDYNKKIPESDLSHLPEIIKYHDYRLSPLVGSKEDFKKRGQKNFKFRCLHHHVFDLDLLKKTFKFFNLGIIQTIAIQTDYIVIGRKNAL